MEQGDVLFCNNLQCRKQLRAIGRACVTNCSHIFCEDCAESAFSTKPVCPACDTQLNHPHDIVLTDLAPPEDFKASALAGLSPETILDIARRGVSFWSYQSAQESLYQKMVQQDLKERIQRLEVQLKGVVNDARTEFGLLREKITALQNNLAEERNRNQDMAEQYAEKDRQYVKLQELYDRLRRKTMVAAATASGSAHLVNGPPSGGWGLPLQPGMNPPTPMVPPQSPKPTTYPRPPMFGRTGQDPFINDNRNVSHPSGAGNYHHTYYVAQPAAAAFKHPHRQTAVNTHLHPVMSHGGNPSEFSSMTGHSGQRVPINNVSARQPLSQAHNRSRRNLVAGQVGRGPGI